jgi:hypothetical protein
MTRGTTPGTTLPIEGELPMSFAFCWVVFSFFASGFACAHASAIPLLKDCEHKTESGKIYADGMVYENGLRGLHAKTDFAVGTVLFSSNSKYEITSEVMQQLNYVNAAAVPDFERLFEDGADLQKIWSSYEQQSTQRYNILIEQTFLHTDFSPTSNKKLLSYNKNNLKILPESVKVTVMKTIKKGEPLLRQYGLTWISLVYQACLFSKKQLCFYDKNFKNMEGRKTMCKHRHVSRGQFASLWNQQERDKEGLVLLDRKTSKNYKRILKKLYSYILPTMTDPKDDSKKMVFLNEMTTGTRELVSLIKRWTKRGLLLIEVRSEKDDL